MNGIACDRRFDAGKGRELVAGGASRDLADANPGFRVNGRASIQCLLSGNLGFSPLVSGCHMANPRLFLRGRWFFSVRRVKRAGRSFRLLLRNLHVAGVRASLAGRVTALAPVEVAGLSLGGIAGEREGERPDWERHRRKSYDDYRGKESYRPTDFQEITFWGEATP